jgi:glycosyltransferase involved in cell wall biosynthesis
LSSRADALIFYSDYPVKKYIDFGVAKERLFVANNTVEVKGKVDTDNEKKYFIFVGTLYKQKRIYELLDAYVKYMASSSIVKPLVLVGDGDEMEPIKTWIRSNDLEKNIILKGSVFDQDELKVLYRDAIACISPGQAGLTVLNSMAYGVPFVTSENAITGGEIFNIMHNETGIIYDGGIVSLAENMKKLTEDSLFLKRLSKNAQDFYFENRTIDIMVEGFLNAVLFASKIPKR